MYSSCNRASAVSVKPRKLAQISTSETRLEPFKTEQSTDRASIDVEQKQLRDLQFFSLNTNNLNLDIGGRLLDGRPKLFLETPDVAVGIEGLLSTLAKTTLAGLATQLTGGVLGPTGGGTTSPLLAPSVPQMKGVQQQYQLQFSRGPWNIESGFQVGVRAQDDPTGTFFSDPDVQPPSVDTDDPQTTFQQASEIYYGQAFGEGYNQGVAAAGSSPSPVMGTPTGTLPTLSTNMPAGYNEGIVAGFTRGLQDGYYAGFQTGRSNFGIQSRDPLLPQTPSTAYGLSTTNTLPRALPHVASGSQLPNELYRAQMAALQAYERNFEDTNFEKKYLIRAAADATLTQNELEKSKEPESKVKEAIDEEKLADLREREFRSQKKGKEMDIKAITPARSNSSKLNDISNPDQQIKDAGDEKQIEEIGPQIEEKKQKIAGMEFMTALLVFSAVLFFCVFFCVVAIGCIRFRKRTKEVKPAPPLKSKVSDMTEVSAYMKSPTLFDNYIYPNPEHQNINNLRSAGAKE